MSPSVRRALLPVLALVLIVTGMVANAPVVALALSWSAGPARRPTLVVAVLLAVTSIVLDRLHRSTGRPRPPAVHTQVPQWWGQRYGPWWAAARYGLRLGVGPATILNTWMWWAGVLIAVSSGPLWAFGATATFVCVRTMVMVGATFGPRDGVSMARRAQQLDRLQWRAELGGQAVVLLAVAAIVVAVVVAGRLAA